MRLDWLPSILSIKQIPIPSDHYTASDSFAETVRATLTTGSVSMRTGRFFTKEDHDKLFDSIKNYRFND
jgi:hypothetical protein